MKEIKNTEEYINQDMDHILSLDEAHHNIKITTNQLIKHCKNAEIPMFLTYYIPGTGYVYQGLFPEDIDTPNVESEFGRFVEFLKTCVKFNQEDYKPVIKLNRQTSSTQEKK